MNHRPERVASLIQEELSQMLVRELEFPGALVTISGVAVTKKLDMAKVRVSVLPAERESGALALIQKKASDLQFKLIRKINIKPMPRLMFELDRGAENAARVEKKLLERQ